jgi:hypothetical protein
MSATSEPTAMRVLLGGMAAEHGSRTLSTASDEDMTMKAFNLPLSRPIACWRLENLRFEFDSSFVKPEAAPELAILSRLWERHGRPPLSIFGHADPVGDDNYNKALSGRRAMAVYGLLTRDAKVWEELYAHPFVTDKWGLKWVQTMLAAAGFDPGPVDGISGSKTITAIKNLQASKGLTADGVVGIKTRAQLFLAYMDAICRDETGAPFSLSRTDFLARGADPEGKGDYQGCSEFNPIMLFSKAENKELSKPQKREERSAANAVNRRVLVFLFPVGSSISPELWPCPRAKEGVARCKAVFWPDGEVRRSFQEKHREYAHDKDTFACSFYDTLAQLSPCESVRKTLRVRLFNPDKKPIANAPYRLSILDTGDERVGTAQPDGTVVETDVLAPSKCLLRWGDPSLKQKPVQLGYQTTLSLDIDLDEQDEDSFRRRLRNLGYQETQFLADSLRAFQRDYDLAKTGELDQPTKDAIIDAANFGLSKNEIAAKN